MTTTTKGRTWTKARLKKFQATMASKKALREGQGPPGPPPRAKVKKAKATVGSPNHADAIVFLRQAQVHIAKRLASRSLVQMDHAHLLAMLALSVLEGGAEP